MSFTRPKQILPIRILVNKVKDKDKDEDDNVENEDDKDEDDENEDEDDENEDEDDENEDEYKYDKQSKKSTLNLDKATRMIKLKSQELDTISKQNKGRRNNIMEDKQLQEIKQIPKLYEDSSRQQFYENVANVADTILLVFNQFAQLIPAIGGYLSLVSSFLLLQISFYDLKHTIMDFNSLLKEYILAINSLLYTFNKNIISSFKKIDINDKKFNVKRFNITIDKLNKIVKLIKDILSLIDKSKFFLNTIYDMSLLDRHTDVKASSDNSNNTPIISGTSRFVRMGNSIKHGTVNKVKEFYKNYLHVGFKILSIFRNPSKISGTIQIFQNILINKIILLLIEINNYLLFDKLYLEDEGSDTNSITGSDTNSITGSDISKDISSKLYEIEKKSEVLNTITEDLTSPIKESTSNTPDDNNFFEYLVDKDNPVKNAEDNKAIKKTKHFIALNKDNLTQLKEGNTKIDWNTPIQGGTKQYIIKKKLKNISKKKIKNISKKKFLKINNQKK